MHFTLITTVVLAVATPALAAPVFGREYGYSRRYDVEDARDLSGYGSHYSAREAMGPLVVLLRRSEDSLKSFSTSDSDDKVSVQPAQRPALFLGTNPVWAAQPQGKALQAGHSSVGSGTNSVTRQAERWKAAVHSDGSGSTSATSDPDVEDSDGSYESEYESKSEPPNIDDLDTTPASPSGYAADLDSDSDSDSDSGSGSTQG